MRQGQPIPPSLPRAAGARAVAFGRRYSISFSEWAKEGGK